MGVKFEVIQRLFQRPVTSEYPKKKAVVPDDLRGKVTWNKKTCIWCRLCEMNCPANAIKIDKEKGTWEIDSGKCIFCGRCQEVCPTKPKSVTLSNHFEFSSKKREKFIDSYKGTPPQKKQPVQEKK